jgi:putative membrane protein
VRARTPLDFSPTRTDTLYAVRRFLLRVLATAVAVLLISQVPQKLIVVKSDQPLATILGFALILGVLNAFLRPILLLLTLPLNLLTLGLVTLVVNAIVFWLASVLQGGGVQVADFGAAFLGALLVSIVSFVASRIFK